MEASDFNDVDEAPNSTYSRKFMRRRRRDWKRGEPKPEDTSFCVLLLRISPPTAIDFS